jgi:hypothetical protein
VFILIFVSLHHLVDVMNHDNNAEDTNNEATSTRPKRTPAQPEWLRGFVLPKRL